MKIFAAEEFRKMKSDLEVSSSPIIFIEFSSNNGRGEGGGSPRAPWALIGRTGLLEWP